VSWQLGVENRGCTGLNGADAVEFLSKLRQILLEPLAIVL
jgi:hypothetical protein